jgi:hypothetical protein
MITNPRKVAPAYGGGLDTSRLRLRIRTTKGLE